MSLENRLLRTATVASTASASLIFSLLGYDSFTEKDFKTAIAYTLSAAISGILSVYSYGRSTNNFNQKIGHFGVSDEAIRAIEKRDSGRYTTR